MRAIDVYQMYLALKQHFSEGSYDYFKYNGKIRVNAQTFQSRRDRFFFEKLSRKFGNKTDDLRDYFVANLSKDSKVWIKELVGDRADKNYRKWKAYQESLTYNFRQDVERIKDRDVEFDDLFLCKDGQHPILVEMYTCGEISRETLIGFDSIFSCFKKWNSEIEDPIVWPDIFQQCERYRPFLNIEQEKFKTVLREGFVA